MKFKVNETLFVDREKISSDTENLQRNFIPFIEDVIEKFKGLHIGDFTQEDFQILIEKGHNPFVDRFTQKVKDESSKVGDSFLVALVDSESISRATVPFIESCKKLAGEVERNKYLPSIGLRADISFIKIESQKPVIESEKITSLHTVKIESENEAVLMKLLNDLKSSYDIVKEFKSKNGIPDRIQIISQYGDNIPGLAYINENDEFEIDPQNVLLLRNHI